MKMFRVLILGCLYLLLFGCGDADDLQVQILSGYVYKLDHQEQVLKVVVGSNTDWRVTGRTAWCSLNKLTGHGNDTLTLNISTNISSEERSTILTVRNGDRGESFKVTQSGMEGEYHYQLSVIFHVLYNNASDEQQNIDGDWLRQILKECNEYYGGLGNNPDMNFEFVPATHTPDGKLLAEPGVERIQWDRSIVMDCNQFMGDKNNIPYLWDQNRYINVMIYAFSNKNVLGISYLPYTISMNALPGLTIGDRYLVDPKVAYPHCISVNNQYVYTKHSALKVNDMSLTLTHELGHYLGMFHVFFKEEDDYKDDYCADTQTYDRGIYEEWLNSPMGPENFTEALMRTAPDGSEFVSYNIMDYDYSYLNRFTADQRQRVRHVLENSPLIPGPKISYVTSKSVINMEIPEARTIE